MIMDFGSIAIARVLEEFDWAQENARKQRAEIERMDYEVRMMRGPMIEADLDDRIAADYRPMVEGDL
jgi:hypothetical protein